MKIILFGVDIQCKFTYYKHVLAGCVQEIDLLKTKLGEAEGRLKYYESQASSPPERDLLATPLISLDSPTPAPPSNTSYSLPTSPSPTPTDPNKVCITIYIYI